MHTVYSTVFNEYILHILQIFIQVVQEPYDTVVKMGVYRYEYFITPGGYQLNMNNSAHVLCNYFIFEYLPVNILCFTRYIKYFKIFYNTCKTGS